MNRVKQSPEWAAEGILQMFCCKFCFQSCGELIRFYWHTHQQADPHLSFTVTEILRWKTAEGDGRKGRENRWDKVDRKRGSDEMKWQGRDGKNSREKKRLRNRWNLHTCLNMKWWNICVFNYIIYNIIYTKNAITLSLTSWILTELFYQPPLACTL